MLVLIRKLIPVEKTEKVGFPYIVIIEAFTALPSSGAEC